jgi:phosphohistidine phosphatase
MTLYVLRHAKSSWKQPGPDHDRPLSGRGRRAGAAIERHLRTHGIAPELVLCSTALRTRQTLELIAPAFDGATVQLERGLYGAGVYELLDRLRRVPEATGSVLVIGHNPGLEDLVLELARPSANRDEVELKFPTGALATLQFPGPWSELGEATAVLVAFVRPRDLA